MLPWAKRLIDQCYRYLSRRKPLTNTYCLCPQTTKYFSTKIENSHFKSKGIKMYLDSCWLERYLLDEHWAEAFWGKKMLVYSVICLEDKCKDKPLSLEDQTKPNANNPHVLESAFLTALYNYYPTRSPYMSNLNIKKKNIEVLPW